MTRDKLLRRILTETRSATLAYYAYMHTDREYVANLNLHLRELHFLIAVGESEGTSMTEIAKHLEVSQGAATQIASRLLKKDLIVKVKEVADKRRTVITLTAQGERAYREYLRVDESRRAEVVSRMQEFSMQELEAILKHATLVKEICTEFLSKEIPAISGT
ncbi:MAG: MarR family transcriptional regulator [Oscillospiraceae bacterium]|nr:MarR family transcriptional regulator [Oscillospiraceae bacterium]